MNSFVQHINYLLQDWSQELPQPVHTPFHTFTLFPSNIIVHCVPLNHQQVLSDSFFADLSDEAQLKGYKIIHLWEDVYLRNPSLVEARLLALVGKRKRIHARKTSIIRIDKQQATDFLSTNHLQGYATSYYKYALMLNDEIVAVATFSKSRVMHDGVVPYRSYELIRFASKSSTTVVGGLGKLLHYFIEQHHALHIMTYADRDWSYGEGYLKLGFQLMGKIPPLQFWVDIENLARHSLQPVTHSEYLKVITAGSLKFVFDRRSQHS